MRGAIANGFVMGALQYDFVARVHPRAPEAGVLQCLELADGLFIACQPFQLFGFKRDLAHGCRESRVGDLKA